MTDPPSPGARRMLATAVLRPLVRFCGGVGAALGPLRRPGRLVGASALALVPLGCGTDGAEAGGGRPPTVVEAAVAERDTIQVSVRSVGSLEAEAQVEVRAEAEGRVSRILFEEGGAIRRGQTLVLIDQDRLRSEMEAEAAAAESERVEAENLGRQVERNRGLLESGAISRQAYDDLKTRWEAAKARLAEARADLQVARQRLEEATVRAPFDGRAGERRVDPGDFVRRGDPLLTAVADDTLEMAFSVPERYVGRLLPGSPVRLAVQSYPDRSFQGEVTFVSPVVDPANRTVRLKARVPNPAGELRSGQFANVLLGLERRPDAVVVPEAAVVPRGGEAFVFLVRQGVARRQPVTIGERSPGIVEMASGVQPGDTVVVAGQQKLRDGSPVAPELRPLRLEVEGGETAGVDPTGESAGAGGERGAASGTSPGESEGPPPAPRSVDDGTEGG